MKYCDQEIIDKSIQSKKTGEIERKSFKSETIKFDGYRKRSTGTLPNEIIIYIPEMRPEVFKVHLLTRERT